MWERAGKPDGADFGSAARSELESKLRGGKSLADICKDLNYQPKSISSVSSSASLSSLDLPPAKTATPGAFLCSAW